MYVSFNLSLFVPVCFCVYLSQCVFLPETDGFHLPINTWKDWFLLGPFTPQYLLTELAKAKQQKHEIIFLNENIEFFLIRFNFMKYRYEVKRKKLSHLLNLSDSQSNF